MLFIDYSPCFIFYVYSTRLAAPVRICHEVLPLHLNSELAVHLNAAVTSRPAFNQLLLVLLASYVPTMSIDNHFSCLP